MLENKCQSIKCAEVGRGRKTGWTTVVAFISFSCLSSSFPYSHVYVVRTYWSLAREHAISRRIYLSDLCIASWSSSVVRWSERIHRRTCEEDSSSSDRFTCFSVSFNSDSLSLTFWMKASFSCCSRCSSSWRSSVRFRSNVSLMDICLPSTLSAMPNSVRRLRRNIS